MKRHCQGFTVAELLVSSFVLSLLMVAAFGIYRMGASAWLKSDAKTELLGLAQVVTAKLNRDVEGSSYRSLAVAADGSGVAFLSAQNEDGVFIYDPVTVMPKWQKYIVIYFDSTAKTLYRHEVSVVGRHQENASMPISSLGEGTLESHFQPSTIVNKGIDELKFSTTADEQLVLEMSATKLRYGSEQPERQSIRVVTTFRNS